MPYKVSRSILISEKLKNLPKITKLKICNPKYFKLFHVISQAEENTI